MRAVKFLLPLAGPSIARRFPFFSTTRTEAI